MDRPTTGKRRVRTGSVHVTELIDRQTRMLDLSVVADEIIRVEPLEPTPDRPAASRAATLAKIAVLGVATATLVGAVAAASLISRDRESGGNDPATRPITGERALLPDELNRAVIESSTGGRIPEQRTGTASGSLSGSTAAPAIPSARRNGAASVDRDQTEAPATGAADHTAEPASTKAAKPANTSHRELVLEYYRLIESDPSRAFALLSGFQTTLGQFLGSWSSVRKVEVLDVVERGDGVVAVVRMHLVGGAQLRIKQLLTVVDSVPQRIVGAVLLSAQIN
ncbi:hypothetical protein [Alloactinosynnema sp. L-07]|uniref:hypothetical protein n=1 Tax=Alloactinosynnema sp. L-07 TaxID=1653480 RepID=UPI00065F058A|nr:hypothetical protein [Alloactinosynnema sp. L-07]CRK59921.1 hypothetical protein [Alloactinosynnema sp. L-07]